MRIIGYFVGGPADLRKEVLTRKVDKVIVPVMDPQPPGEEPGRGTVTKHEYLVAGSLDMGADHIIILAYNRRLIEIAL
jgi:hypothetical protein